MREQRLVEYTALRSEDMATYGIILCFYTGIRLGELCALKWSDIDFEAGIMSVSRTVSRVKNLNRNGNKTMLLVGSPKSNKSVRKIPLPDFMLKHAAEFKTYYTNENDYVISGTDTPIDPRTYQKLYRRIIANAGIKYRKFHAIRHTFATRALELGVDIKTLSEILGHANISITLGIYAHSLMEQKKIAMDKLNNMHLTYMEPA
jgi:integrase